MKRDNVVLIPGANRPFGRAIARKFGDNSCRLVLPYFSDWPESTEEMKAEFSEKEYEFFACPFDLTDKKKRTDYLSTLPTVSAGSTTW